MTGTRRGIAWWNTVMTSAVGVFLVVAAVYLWSVPLGTLNRVLGVLILAGSVLFVLALAASALMRVNVGSPRLGRAPTFAFDVFAFDEEVHQHMRRVERTHTAVAVAGLLGLLGTVAYGAWSVVDASLRLSAWGAGLFLVVALVSVAVRLVGVASQLSVRRTRDEGFPLRDLGWRG